MTLRRREAFAGALVVYGVVTFFISLFWALLSEAASMGTRDEMGLTLFTVVIALGNFLFCVYGGLLGARTLVSEREKRTSQMLRLAPARPSSILFQKAVAPMLHAWLLFFGLLPILSLIFLLGGVSAKEFAFHLTNIGIWINTSILLGLFVSARSKSSTKAVGASLGLLVQAAVLVPYAHLLLEELANSLLLPSVELPSLALLIAPLRFVAWCTAPLAPLSPIWMFMSFYSVRADPGFPPPDAWMLFFPFWPTLYSYALHLVLQAVLFGLAVRAWVRVPDDSEANIELSDVKGPGGMWRWMREGRAKRGLFLPGWWAVFQQEDRATFKKGLLAKAGVAGILAGVIAIVQYLIIRNGLGDGRSVVLIVPVFGAIALITALGFSSNALRREKQRDTATLLTVSPHPPHVLFFGKWLFYTVLSFGILIFGLALATVYSGVFWFQGRSFVVQNPLQYAYPSPFLAAYIPLSSLLGTLVGLQARRRISLVKVLVVLGILWVVGGTGIATITGLESVDALFESLYWLFSRGLPMAAVAGAALVAVRRSRSGESSGPGAAILFRCLALGLLVIAGAELFCMAVIDREWGAGLRAMVEGSDYRFGSRFNQARTAGKNLIVPLLLAFLLWAWVRSRPTAWWRKRMLGERGEEFA